MILLWVEALTIVARCGACKVGCLMKLTTMTCLGFVLGTLTSASGQTDPRFGRWISILGGDPAWAEGVEVERRHPGRSSVHTDKILVSARDGSELPLRVILYPHEAALFDKTRRTDQPVLKDEAMIIRAGAQYLADVGFDMEQFTQVTVTGKESIDSAFQNGLISLSFDKKVNGLQTSWEGVYIALDPISGRPVHLSSLQFGAVTYESIDGVMSEEAAIARAKEIARAYYQSEGPADLRSDLDQPATIGLGYGVYGGGFGSEVSGREAQERTHKPPVYLVMFGSTSVSIHAKTGENLGGGIMKGVMSASREAARPAVPKPIPFSWKSKGGAAQPESAKPKESSQGLVNPVAILAGIAAVGGIGLATAAYRRKRPGT